jgi:hypothetical protein
MMRSKAKKTILATALALCALGALLIAAAGAETVRVGNLVITIDGGITPKKLPKKEAAPITLKLNGTLKSSDGTHPAALKTLDLEFDRHGHLNTKGLATCTAAKLQSTLTSQAKASCPEALVGQGRVSAEIAFPEQAPFPASGPLLIFNGAPKGAKQVLIFHVYAHVPAPTTFVTTAVISKQGGKYGTRAEVAIPTIVSGQGSLTSFEAKIARTFTYKGKKQALLTASCPTGTLYAHGEFSFADGTRASGDVVRPCTPKG